MKLNPNAKARPAQIAAFRAALLTRSGVPIMTVARDLGLTEFLCEKAIYRIAKGESWAHVKPKEKPNAEQARRGGLSGRKGRRT